MADYNLSQDSGSAFTSRANDPVIREYWQCLVDRWWVVAIVVLLAVGYGANYIYHHTPLYVARSVILIEEHGAQVMHGLEAVDQTDPRGADVMNTMIETMHSPTLLRLVVDSMNLQDSPDFLPPNPKEVPYKKEVLVEALSKCVDVSLRKKTRLVDITVQHSNPKMAAQLANAIGKEFIRLGVQDRINSARSAAEFLTEQAGKYRDKLQQSELALDKYRETNNATSLESNQNFVLEQLKTLNMRLDIARATRFNLEGDLEKAIELVNRPKELVNIPSISKQLAVSTIVARLAEQEAAFAVLSQRYKSLHPKYIAAVAEIDSLKQKFDQVVIEAAAVLKADCIAAKDNEQRLVKLVSEQEAASLKLSRQAIDYNMLKREAEANRTMYDSMVSRMKEVDVTAEIDRSPIKIVESAQIPEVPIRFDKLKIIIGSTFIGFFLGGGLVIAQMLLSPRVITVGHVDRHVGVPVVGAIPKWRNQDGPKVLDYFKTNNHAFAEACRTLRTSMLIGQAIEPKTFMITSAVPNEGKTFISSCLSVAFAHMGVKTLLIDLDLRKRSLSRQILGNKTQPGLVEFLQGHATFEEILQPTTVENCFVIPAGGFIENPAELLRKNVLQPLIQVALQSFEKIVIDTPPILSVSDALILASDIEKIYLTAWSGKSHGVALRNACHALISSGRSPDGIILNAIHSRHSNYYYYYGKKEHYGEPDNSGILKK